MKEKYEISIENVGDYKVDKKFGFTTEMTPQEFLEFCDVVICEFPELQTPHIPPPLPASERNQ